MLLESLYEEQSDIVKRYDTSLPPHGDTIEAITQNIDDSIYIHRGIETLINKNVKEKERIYDQLIFSTERGNPVTVGTIRKLDNGSDFENTYIDYLASVVTNNGFKDPNQPKHIASKKKIIDYIKKVKSEDGIRAKEDIIKFKEAQKKLDEIKAKGFDLSKISESEMSVTKNYRNFPKLWRSEFGTDVKQVTDSKGNNWMRVKIPENFYQNDISLPPSEIKTYRKGGKALKGLMKKYNEGGLFQKLRDKRAKRRLGRTNVRNFPTGEVLESLAGTNPYSGYFRPDTRDVYMSPVTGDKSVMDHELIHSTQMGPLQQMADALGFNAGRIQDKNSRKAFRKLYRSIKKEDTILDDLYRKQQIEQGRKGNEIRSGLGDYMMGKKSTRYRV